jgi:cytochrome P450
MKRRFPNGPTLSFPRVVIGQMFPSKYPFDPLAFYLGMAREYGDIAYFRLGPLRIYLLNHPELIRQVLVEQAPKFHKPSLVKRGSRPSLGRGLITSDGLLWKQQRKLIQPAFRHDRLAAAYGDVISAYAERMVSSFEDGEVRSIDDDMGKLTLAIVVKSLFGQELSRDADEIGELLLAVADASNERMNSPYGLLSWIPTRRNLRERRALARFDEIIRVLIRTRRQSAGQREDLLSALLSAADADTGERMSDRQLRDEMMTLFLAGQDTTAHALSWTWYLLARHPDVEAKLLEELRRVLAGRAPRATDLPNLPYTEMIVREAIRLFPPAPFFARQPIEDVTVGEWEIPKGSLIVVSTYALQRDRRFFSEPEQFNPDRFAPGWEERISRFAYLPFGGGPRVCIGNGFAMMEVRLVLATVAQRCKLSLESNTEIAPKQLVTLRPSHAVRMRVEKRAEVDLIARAYNQ